MSRLLTPHDRRVAAAGAIAIAGLLGAFRGVPAWLGWRTELRAEARERVSRAHERSAHLAALPAALDSLEARTIRLRRVGPSLFVATSAAEAGSNLAAYIGEAARSARVRLDAATMRSDSAGASVLSAVRVEAQATTDITGLTLLLRSLETGPMRTSLRQLVVRPLNIASPSDQPEMLTIRFTVEAPALIRVEGPSRGER
jgi:hypothetical protein